MSVEKRDNTENATKKNRPNKKQPKPLKQQMIQNSFYAYLKEEKFLIDVVMNSGRVYKGTLVDYDQFNVKIEKEETEELVLLFKGNMEAMYKSEGE